MLLGFGNALLAQKLFEFIEINLAVAHELWRGLSEEGEQFGAALGGSIWAVAEVVIRGFVHGVRLDLRLIDTEAA